MNKKNIIVLSVVTVLMIFLLVGATYAYFVLEINSKDYTNTKVNVNSSNNSGLITLNKGVSSLHLNLNNKDMAYGNANIKYYADDDENYVTNIEDGTHIIGTVSVEGNENNFSYKCNVEVKVTLDTSEGSIGSVIEEGDGKLYINVGDKVKGYDLVELKENNPLIIKSSFIIEDDKEEVFKAYVRINNQDKDQGYLAYKKLNIEILPNNLECNVYNEPKVMTKLREDDSNETLSSKLSGGMYRYQGDAEKVNSNYICFGTSDKDECITDEEHHMYRIIGITPDGSLKVIKKTALENKGYLWNDNYNVDIKWPESMIYTAINGEDFLNNSEYFTDQWQSEIVDTTWKYGSMASDNINNTGIELYQIESGKKLTTYDEIASSEDKNAKSIVMSNGDNIGSNIYYFSRKDYWTDEVTSKISAMYYHDYVLSISDTANCEFNNNYEICKNGWLHHTNNVSSDFLKYSEFTISYYNLFPEWGRFFSNGIMDTGSNSVNWFRSRLIVRPVFYITNDIELSGTGTIIDPYIINI